MILQWMKRNLYPANHIGYLYIDLIVLVFLFYHVLKADSPFGLLGSLALLALFLLAFYVSLWNRNWRLPVAAICGCGLLAIFSSYTNEWLLLYGFIFSDLLGRARSKVQILVGLFGFAAMYLASFTYLKGAPFAFVETVHLPVLILQLLVPAVVYITERTKFLQRELATANETIEKYIQEEERHRIARDLHDTLGQTLTMIKLKSELATRLIERQPEQAKQEMDEVMRTARLALHQVRELVTAMKHVSLLDEIEYARELMRVAQITLIVEESTPAPRLSKVAETMLALSVREAFTNILKHSQAETCHVTTELTDGWYHVHIVDDGVGLAQQETEGNGLASMRERMRLLQGRVQLTASTHGGVAVTLSVPLSEGELSDSPNNREGMEDR